MSETSLPQIKIVIIEGPDKGKVIPLKNGTAVIGRAKGDFIVQDPRVSRSHIAFHFDEKTQNLSFNDLQSLNGVTVNGAPQKEGTLKDGDRVQIGNTVFDCQLTESTVLATKISESVAPKSESSPIKEVPPEPLQMTNPEVMAPIEPTQSANPQPQPAAAFAISRFQKAKNYYLSLTPRRRQLYLATTIVVFGILFLALPSKQSVNPKTWETISSLKKDGKWDEAILKAEEVSKDEPNNPEIFYTLGTLYEEKNRYEEAIRAFQKSKEIKKTPLVPVRLLRLYAKTGLASTDAATRELAQIDSYIKEGPQSAEFVAEAAKLFLENKEYKQPPEKIFILAKALQSELAPDKAIGFKIEGQLFFQQNRLEDALKAFETALKKDPNDEWVIENIAFTKVQLKDNAGAASAIDYWTKIHPDSSKAQLVMAYFKINANDHLGAFPYLQKITQKPADPLYPEALHLMGQVYTHQNQIADANTVFQKSCEMGYKPSCEYLASQHAPDMPSEPPPTQ